MIILERDTPNETERLGALEGLQIVGTLPAPEFDAILALARMITGCSHDHWMQP